MAWDSSRPVPWNRLVKEAAIFLVIGGFLFAVVFRKSSSVGSYIGLFIGMFLYVGFSYVLAKFGYTRESMKQNRARQMAARQARSTPAATAALSRPKPPPTKRTSSGPSNRPKSKKR
jgi:hypothetical protein